MLLGKFSGVVLALLTCVQGKPVATTDAVEGRRPYNIAWKNATHHVAEPTTADGLDNLDHVFECRLEDGNNCEMRTRQERFTQRWRQSDWVRLYTQAARVLVGNLRSHNSNEAGQTMGFTDSQGRRHDVDCEVVDLGQAYVSSWGAAENTFQALSEAAILADEKYSGMYQSTRLNVLVYFGTVAAISIAVNVIN